MQALLAELQSLSLGEDDVASQSSTAAQDKLNVVFAKAGQLRDTIARLPLPDGVQGAVEAAYDAMCDARGETVAVAVRSSATTEDTEEASFAGQHDTFLNQCGLADIIASIRRCWASVFTDRAVEYRNRQRIAHAEAVMCVVVQAMVVPEVAGTAFSAELATSFPAIHIAATYGLGEVRANLRRLIAFGFFWGGGVWPGGACLVLCFIRCVRLFL